MSGGKTKVDNFYKINSPDIRQLLQTINKREHFIGIHPSYNAYLDKELFKNEVNALQEISPQPVRFGRQHFLRFETPHTWQIWEDNGLEWDSTLCYPEQAGFRCGICQPFHVFNFLTRKKLNLKEIPLTVMEGSYATYQNATPADTFKGIQNLMTTVKKYGGTFVLLWHNSAFNTPHYEKFEGLYEEIVQTWTKFKAKQL